jgi:hypothetical protein
MTTTIRRTLIALFLLGSTSPSAVPPQRPPSEERLWAEAVRLHREAIVVDTHSDVTSRMLDEGFDIGRRATDGHMDIPRMKEGGLTRSSSPSTSPRAMRAKVGRLAAPLT